MAFPEGYGPREHERALARLVRDIENHPQKGRQEPLPERPRVSDDPPLRLVRVPSRDDGAMHAAEGDGR